MKSAKLLLALAATGLVATSAFAQKSAFEGFYGQIATGYENNTLQNTNLAFNSNAGPADSATSSAGGTATAGGAPIVLGLGYTFSVAPKFTVGLGADYSALTQTTGVTTYNFGGGCADPDGGCVPVKYKISNRYNIFLTPGYEIDKDKMAYLKVGYSAQTVQVTDQDGGNGTNSTVSGIVAGLGYKQIITGGLYGFGEFNYFNYSKLNQSTGTTNGSLNLNQGVNAYNLLVGVGYKF